MSTRQIVVTAPPGAFPGSEIQVQLPDGQYAVVRVPAGTKPGGQFVLNITTEPPPERQRPQRKTKSRRSFRALEEEENTPVLQSTGDPVKVTRDSDCGLWYKCICCPCYLPFCCGCFTKQVAFIYTGEVAVIEKFDKYERMASPGEALLYAPFGNLCPCLNEKVAKRLSMRIRELPITSKTKTLDNVFIEITVVVMFQIPDESMAYNAAYKLTNIRSQIGDYVEDVVRSKVASLELDQVFISTHDIATAVLNQVAEKLNDFGFQVVSTLITRLEPDPSVRDAMNEVNTQRRLKAAQVFNAEAEKAVEINRAEADAECKYLQGVGLASMRKAIIDGLSESVDTISNSSEYSHDDATNLLLITQYMDALEQLGQAANYPSSAGGGPTIFLPVGFDALAIMRARLQGFKSTVASLY